MSAELLNQFPEARPQLGYIDSAMLNYYQDYFKNYRSVANSSDRKVLCWQNQYVSILRDGAQEEKAADFMGLQFLVWNREFLTTQTEHSFTVPAEDEFYQLVNNQLRRHLSNCAAESKGLTPGMVIVPLIDWHNQEQYVDKAFGTADRELLGHIWRPDPKDHFDVTTISSDYAFYEDGQGIFQVNYYFTPFAL